MILPRISDFLTKKYEPFQENEIRLLISILFDFDGKIWPRVSPHLSEESFTLDDHKTVYNVIIETYEKEGRVDACTCIPYIPIQYAAFFSALGDIFDYCPVTAYWETYLRLVIENQVTREAKKWGASLSNITENPQKTLEDIKNKSELLALKTQFKENIKSSKKALVEFHQDLENRFNGSESFDSIPTGIPALDEFLNGGFRNNELVIIGARPGMGKTSLAMDFFTAPYLQKKQSAILFSLEMSCLDLTRRMVSHHAKIRSSALIKGDFDYLEAKIPKIIESMGILASEKLFIDDSVDQNVESIEATIQRQWKISGKPSIIIIDYLQLMGSIGESYSRENEVSKISRGLKKIAKKYEIPVIVLCQINRLCEKREDGRPVASDLRESGAIEQDADKIIFINRPNLLGKHDDPEYSELIISKNRIGGTGILKGRFDGEHTKFYF